MGTVVSLRGRKREWGVIGGDKVPKNQWLKGTLYGQSLGTKGKTEGGGIGRKKRG